MTDFVNAAKNVINNLDGSAKELEATKEVLDVLQELADTRAELFASQIQLAHQNAGVGSDTTLPVESTGETRKVTHTYTASRSEPDILNNVEKNINDLLGTIQGGGEWSDIAGAGIKIATGLIKDALTLFLADSAGTGKTEYRSTIVLNASTMNILRIDYGMWNRGITTSAIRTRHESILAVAYSKSIVDVSKVKLNTFREYFQPIIDQENPDLTAIQRIQKAQELYVALGGQSSLPKMKLLGTSNQDLEIVPRVLDQALSF